MLLLPGHGTTVVPDDYDMKDDTYKGRKMTVSSACGFGNPGDYPSDPAFGRFDYLFPDAAPFEVSDDMTARLDALATEMVKPTPADPQDSSIAPVFTYFGQFIDHDITANTDRETGLSVIDVEKVTPVPRSKVSGALQNLREATLNLDSVHGGGPVQGPIAKRFDDALRFHRDRAMLWAGTVESSDFAPIPFPKDPADLARDVLRADRFLRQDGLALDEAFLRGLPEEMRALFVNDDDSMRPQRAIIGDMRNDENLAVSQFHLALVRLHNRIVVHAPQHDDAPTGDRDALFKWARRMTSWHYQWLVLNSYLPAVCDAQTLEQVRRDGPRVYNRFLRRVGTPAGNSNLLPLPLEFSVAAFRFGHTMIRAEYDWSFQFGRPESAGILNSAELDLLFLFTGNGQNPMGGGARLPQHWPIEWDRFVHPPTTSQPDRSARKIDTRLAAELGRMSNEHRGISGIMAQLAARNLRRGYRLNLPSAQACLAGLRAHDGITLPVLSAADMQTGDAAFDHQTPLWFYVLKEAEVLGEQERLGPLGSLLVADTLTGLVHNDPASHVNSSEQGPDWHPRDGVRPDDIVIDSMAAMMDAARLL